MAAQLEMKLIRPEAPRLLFGPFISWVLVASVGDRFAVSMDAEIPSGSHRFQQVNSLTKVGK